MLIKTRCTEGHLAVSDTSITIEPISSFQTQKSMMRSACTGVDIKVTTPSVFGMGGGATLTFHSQGSNGFQVHLVKPSVAKQIVALLRS